MINSLKNLRRPRMHRSPKVEPNRFDKIFEKMSIAEQREYTFLYMQGLHDPQNNTIMMGSEQFDCIDEFKNKMIEKYGEANNIIT
jgi:hypothetical protein